jgi:CBS domain containing-hemolysin-like protein
MSFTGELAVLAVGVLCSAAANGSRTAIPELVNDKGRDPSDRRREAATRLRTIWLARVTGLLLTGAGSVLVSFHLSYPRWAASAVVALVCFALSEVVPPVFVQHLPEGRAKRIFHIPMVVLGVLFRLPARLFLGREDNATEDWAYTPPDTLWLEQRREKGDQEELEKEQELVDSILEFSDKIVREVMVPRIDMDSIELCDNIGSIVAQVKKAGHSRIPVYRKIIDDIAGVLYAKDLLGVPMDAKDGEFKVEDLIREAYFVPEFKRIDELFAEFQTNRIHMAVVVDEYGGTAGIVTMEDIVEEVFGEIRDEFDSEPPMVRSLGKNSYRVDARLPINDLNDLLGTEFEEEENYESVGGLVYHQMGHIPESGESQRVDSWIFTVEKVSGQRILFVKVSPAGSAESD